MQKQLKDILKSKNHNQAFTLLEMLLVIAIIAILAGIVIVAINPGRQLAQARNAQRWNDVRSLHAAVQQYYIDNKEWPAGLDQTETDGTMLEVCRSGETSGCLDLESDLVPNYLSAIPEDPQASTTSTLYRIGINPTSKTPNVLAVNSTEYDLEEVKIITECGDPTDVGCWAPEEQTRSWGPTQITLNDILNDTNGKTNTQTLVDRPESFPAAEYCHNLDAGGYTDWYLPAKDQIGDAFFTVDSPAALLFSTANEFTRYWSSSVPDNVFRAWALSTWWGWFSDATRTVSYLVRCMR